MSENKPLFLDLDADNPETTEIESLCMQCHENGYTRLLLTKIPFYKEVVLMSFSCDHCGYQNNEIQSSGQVAEKGIKITVIIKHLNDLNRQVVKSDYTSFKIKELDFEVPPKSQKGEVTTVEGILTRCITGLEQDQVLRRIQHPEAAEQIDAFIKKLEELKELENPFTLYLEDISGNCHVENPHAPNRDPEMSVTHFVRTNDQNHELGFYSNGEIHGEGVVDKKDPSGVLHPIAEDEFQLENFHGEVMQFATNCSNCGSPCETNMKMTDIPHFKEVIIMATVCDACGHKTNEVKSGGGVELQGLRLEITVKSIDDFSRDVLKSDTCSLSIPELELEVGGWALGGRFTTVEGILSAIRDQLANPSYSHLVGDSQRPESKEKLNNFLVKFDEITEGKREVTLILDDPAGNSYVQSMRDDDLPDDQLKIIKYDRTFEQNEELGLNDMKTENY